jgi:membrane-associated protease RseP (regulator of RpoE activity)
LENLKSILETGVDLRVARQPFLGISLDLMDPERAAEEGIGAERGIYVLAAVEGSGAQAAGLGKGDVIVSLGGKDTPGFQELTTALRAHRAGDVVEVEVVRGQERETVEVTLGQRPQVDVPTTAEGLASLLAERYGEVNAELKASVSGLAEKDGEQTPAAGEWSVKQVLAHLSSSERDSLFVLAHMAVNGWLDADPINPDEIPGQIGAVLAVTPTLSGLLERLFASQAEVVALLRRLPEETVTHKARFRRLGQMVLFGPDHIHDHVGQIERTREAVENA